jgi:hypothetical protein
MIHDADKKLLLLLPPKTGSQTLRSLFISRYGNDIPRHFYSHISYNDITNILTDINIDEYTIYGFYREPVARFMSTFKYFQRQINGSIKFRAEDGEDKDLKRVYKALYNDEDTTRDPASITIDDVLNAVENQTLVGPVLDLFLPQTRYLTDKVTLLDFEDFENNAKMLLGLFGMDNTRVIPKDNDTNSSDYLSDLTEAQIAKIKELYAIDYAFLESHNITF